MREAVNKSQEYGVELEAVQAFAENDERINSQITILKRNAKYGIPRIDVLQQEFSANADKILKISRQEKQNKSLLDKAALKLSSVVHVQKITGDENSMQTEDIIARARAALESGKIDIAITEISALDAQEAAKPLPSGTLSFKKWVEHAQDYLNAKDAAETIFRYVTSPGFGNSNTENG